VKSDSDWQENYSQAMATESNPANPERKRWWADFFQDPVVQNPARWWVTPAVGSTAWFLVGLVVGNPTPVAGALGWFAVTGVLQWRRAYR
jgi:hypothetical protein